MLQYNELMEKIDSMEEASGLFIKGHREDQRVGDPKGIQRLITVLLLLLQETVAHQEKMYEIQGDAEEKKRQRF